MDKSTTIIASISQENETQDVHSTTQTNIPKTPTSAPTTQKTTTLASTNISESSNPTLASVRSRSTNT